MFMQLFHTLFHSGGLTEDLYSTFLGKTRTTDHNLANSSLLALLPSCNRHQVSLLAAASITTQLQHITVHKFPLATWCANIKISEQLSTLLYKNLTSINCGIGTMQALRLKDLRKRNDQAMLHWVILYYFWCVQTWLYPKNTTCERHIHENTKHAKHLTLSPDHKAICQPATYARVFQINYQMYCGTNE